MSVVAADANPIFVSIECGACRSGILVAELDMAVDEVADRLHPSPSRRNVPEAIQAIWLSRSVSQ
jgi:hypothetical protein